MAGVLPKRLKEMARRTEEYARGMATGGTFFEELASTMSARSTATISTTLSDPEELP